MSLPSVFRSSPTSHLLEIVRININSMRFHKDNRKRGRVRKGDKFTKNLLWPFLRICLQRSSPSAVWSVSRLHALSIQQQQKIICARSLVSFSALKLYRYKRHIEWLMTMVHFKWGKKKAVWINIHIPPSLHLHTYINKFYLQAYVIRLCVCMWNIFRFPIRLDKIAGFSERNWERECGIAREMGWKGSLFSFGFPISVCTFVHSFIWICL